jgi:GNAT superfamily N-acetyltransferase
MPADTAIRLRPLTAGDLEPANAVIEAAIMSWGLPDRVKRLSLPSYRYEPHDLDHLTLKGAEDSAGSLVGVAAWEPANRAETPNDRRGLLLHGIYVIPTLHRGGVGSRLLDAALRAARAGGFDGLLVKATRGAQGFFRAKGLSPLPVENAARDYPYRFWKALTAD